MMKRRRIGLIVLMLVFSVGIGMSFFGGVDLNHQFELATFLAGMAASVFGILGIWIAVLEPKDMLDGDLDKSEAPSEQLVLALMGPWLYATAVLGISIVVVVVIGTLLAYASGCPFVQGISGAAVILLLFLLLYSLTSTLIPVARILKEVRDRQIRKEYRKP